MGRFLSLHSVKAWLPFCFTICFPSKNTRVHGVHASGCSQRAFGIKRVVFLTFSIVQFSVIWYSVSLTSNRRVAYNRYMNWDNDVIFKALSDSTRRLILDELSERNEQTLYELTVRLITKHNLSITRQAIAKHISALEDAGLVKSEKKGKYRVIIFNNEPLKNLLKGWVE